MSKILLRTALACVVLSATACQVTETTRLGGHVIVRNINEDTDGKDMKEVKLLERVEEDPDSARNWWRLGDYYERMRNYTRAIQAYEQMQIATEKQEIKHGRKYVGALYLLAKCHALINNHTVAVSYLKRILALQPKDMRRAIGVPDFAEAHYLLGAIYYENRMFAEAEKHLIAFKELRPGEHRADGMLIGIEDAIRPERRSWYVKGDNTPQRAAAKINTSKQGSVRVEGEGEPTENGEKAPEKAPEEAPAEKAPTGE